MQAMIVGQPSNVSPFVYYVESRSRRTSHMFILRWQAPFWPSMYTIEEALAFGANMSDIERWIDAIYWLWVYQELTWKAPICSHRRLLFDCLLAQKGRTMLRSLWQSKWPALGQYPSTSSAAVVVNWTSTDLGWVYLVEKDFAVSRCLPRDQTEAKKVEKTFGIFKFPSLWPKLFANYTG